MDQHRAHHTKTAWRLMRDNQRERLLRERGHETDARIVKRLDTTTWPPMAARATSTNSGSGEAGRQEY